MIVNGSNLNALYYGYRAEFDRVFSTVNPDWRQIATVMQSTKRTEEYNWGAGGASFREWISDAQFEHLEAYRWQIQNRTYQGGLEIDREDLLDDNLGWIQARVNDLARDAAEYPGKLITTLLEAGDSTVGYDGQYFFDTDHKDGTGPTQSNKTTGALTGTTLSTMRLMFRRWKNTKSAQINGRMTHLVVPPELEGTARGILEAEYLADGVTPNVNRSSVQLIVLDGLTSAVKWYGMDLSRGIKPLIWQQREDVQFVAQDSMSDEQAFMRKKYRYSAFLRGGAGYGPWQLAAMSTGV